MEFINFIDNALRTLQTLTKSFMLLGDVNVDVTKKTSPHVNVDVTTCGCRWASLGLCLPVTSGVPQGSVLGPLLFLLYVNDIVDVVKPNVQIRLFADDCVLFKEITHTSDQDDLNDSLSKIFYWCTEWGMTLNVEKSVFLPISRKKTSLPYSYTLGSSALKQVTNYKYLGVTLCSSNLSWNLHVQNISFSAFRKLCFLKYKLKHALSSVKLLAYT